MKKTVLLLSLAIPAVAGGIAAILTTQKSGRNGKKADEQKSSLKNRRSSSLNTNSTDKIKNENINPVQDMIMEKPDLDKDLNMEKIDKRPIKRRNKNIQNQDKVAISKDGNPKKIFTGAKGGKYYLNTNGSKVYIKSK